MKLEACSSRRLILPEVQRDRRQIPAQIRAAFNAVLTGKAPWPLCLMGAVGTGKTLAALCLCDRVGGGSIYRTVVEACEELMQAMNGKLFDTDGRPLTTTMWWANWRTAKLTVMDEIAAREKVTDYQYEVLKRALDAREGKASVWISNKPVSEIQHLYDDRVASRLVAGTYLVIEGEDRRARR